MLRKNLFTLVLSGAVLVACGDDSTDDGTTSGDGSVARPDAGSVDSAVRDSATPADAASGDAGSGLLQSGVYNVSAIVKITDDCKLGLEDPTDGLKTIRLDNTGTNLSLGNFYDATTDPKWAPAGYGLGSGPYATPTTANLSVSSHLTFATEKCEFDITRTTKVVYTANNTITVDYTDNETGQTAGCTAANGFVSSTCTSHYTFTMTKAN